MMDAETAVEELLPTTEARTPFAYGGVGSLPGKKDESGIALTPEERVHPESASRSFIAFGLLLTPCHIRRHPWCSSRTWSSRSNTPSRSQAELISSQSSAGFECPALGGHGERSSWPDEGTVLGHPDQAHTKRDVPCSFSGGREQ